MRNSRHGIYLVNEGYVVLDGNVLLYNDFDVTYTYDGINVAAGCSYVTISDNQLEDNRRYGIYTGAPNTVIEGNGVTLSQESGIVVAALDCTVSNNNVYSFFTSYQEGKKERHQIFISSFQIES